MHDKGNEENVFDRVDFQLSKADSIHLNLGLHAFLVPDAEFVRHTRTPALSGLPVDNGALAPTASPSEQPTSVRRSRPSTSLRRGPDLINSNTVFTLGAFVRRDQYNYYPSGNPFADLGPDFSRKPSARTAPLPMPAFARIFLYVKGIHNLKAGATYQQTFLDEKTHFGIVDPTLNFSALMPTE